jgi:hypothetical protein
MVEAPEGRERPRAAGARALRSATAALALSLSVAFVGVSGGCFLYVSPDDSWADGFAVGPDGDGGSLTEGSAAEDGAGSEGGDGPFASGPRFCDQHPVGVGGVVVCSDFDEEPATSVTAAWPNSKVTAQCVLDYDGARAASRPRSMVSAIPSSAATGATSRIQRSILTTVGTDLRLSFDLDMAPPIFQGQTDRVPVAELQCVPEAGPGDFASLVWRNAIGGVEFGLLMNSTSFTPIDDVPSQDTWIHYEIDVNTTTYSVQVSSGDTHKAIATLPLKCDPKGATVTASVGLTTASNMMLPISATAHYDNVVFAIQ